MFVFMGNYKIMRMRIFSSRLGWIALVTDGNTVEQLTFGHRSPAAAKRGIDPELIARAEIDESETQLSRRLQAYASDGRDAFGDVEVDLDRYSTFQRRVLRQCRHIPVGHTVSYAELAADAGFPRAARAVGNCMAANRTPLIVSCHRVVRSDGRIGPYSGPGGCEMKRRLLELEGFASSEGVALVERSDFCQL